MSGAGRVAAALALLVAALSAWPALAELDQLDQPESQLVFGSFAEPENAQRFAAEVSLLLSVPASVVVADRLPETGESTKEESTELFRVVGPKMSAAGLANLSSRASELGLRSWRLLPIVDVPPTEPADDVADTFSDFGADEPEAGEPELDADELYAEEQPPAETGHRELLTNVDLDLGLQNRLFAERGSNTNDRAQQSASALLSWSKEFGEGLNLIAFEAFARVDSDDAHRTHADLRELSYTRIADRWQLQAGVGQVFWGVVEFNHLIDIVNQTDLVEDPDGEDKLGQPMITFTALPGWGSVELFVLPGFRERTLPGISGRLTAAVPIDRSAAEFESGAGKNRVDGLLRVSTQFGGVLFDAYYFNGTRRTPRFEVRSRSGTFDSDLFLVPSYDTIQQTAIEAQVNTGDTAIKLEALQQDGGPESYWAAALGTEHTFVGVFGGAMDLGAVVEYHYDSRGGTAFDSFFENDLALGARLAANDINDSQALLGVVWDTSSHETVVVLEASRRLSDRWSLEIESRWFAGGDALGRAATLAELLDTNNQLGSVQRDDYIQFEFTRFF